MIEAHVLDSWTRLDQRGSSLYGWSMILGGMGAPLFLFLAGLSVSLSAGSKARRLQDDQAASRLVVMRGLQIFALAFLFRIQALIVSWGSWWSLLKVDILNIMGPSIVAAALLWQASRSTRGRAILFAAAAVAVAVLTPPIRGFEWLFALPDPIEGYLRPRPGFTNFAFFPWMGFVFAGASVGVLLDAARTTDAERRANLSLAAGGLLVGLVAYAGSYLPSIFANSQFWTSSPTFFLIRTAALVLAVPAAFAWAQWRHHWSPLEQLGRTSLFIYWIHIELIYGLVVLPLHKSLTFPQAWLGVIVFSLLMLTCSLVKERVAASLPWRRRPTGGPQTTQTTRKDSGTAAETPAGGRR
jgi:uncharacterized membrane protein